MGKIKLMAVVLLVIMILTSCGASVANVSTTSDTVQDVSTTSNSVKDVSTISNTPLDKRVVGTWVQDAMGYKMVILSNGQGLLLWTPSTNEGLTMYNFYTENGILYATHGNYTDYYHYALDGDKLILGTYVFEKEDNHVDFDGKELKGYYKSDNLNKRSCYFDFKDDGWLSCSTGDHVKYTIADGTITLTYYEISPAGDLIFLKEEIESFSIEGDAIKIGNYYYWKTKKS